eukprot:TRINITY_DN3730_c0_g2_i1.p1 TRINITY_DN3730_c0_g2~~TRINITY_DN3730_c0_g2_i1.p1  ORF type:complete len:234 (-),score=22.38 TRINITY_DN3730_c0_g2_i1:115-816(-)
MYILLILAVASATQYDYYKLSVEWQGTVCLIHKCQANIVGLKDPRSFNLHGLWPSQFADKMQPQNCPSPPFSKDELPEDLQMDLQAMWNGLYADTWDFLSHEWNRHGSCWDNHTNNIFSDFFTQTLNLSSRFNLYNALQERQIVPSYDTQYSLEDILGAFRSTLAVNNFVVICGSKSGVTYLQEIRICLGLDYQPIECPSEVLEETDGCGDELVSYPPFEVPRHLRGAAIAIH